MVSFIINLLYAAFILNNIKYCNHKYINNYRHKSLHRISNYNNSFNYNNLNNSNKTHNYVDDLIKSKIAMASYPLVFNFPKF